MQVLTYYTPDQIQRMVKEIKLLGLAMGGLNSLIANFFLQYSALYLSLFTSLAD